MPITTFSLAVVGVAHPNKRGPSRKFAIDLCRPGDPVQLVPEPKNPKDPRAVMVMNNQGMQMGYITAERAPWIGRMIRDGLDLKPIYQEPAEWGAIIRISLDANDPDLPPERIDKSEPEWWPDEIYPEE